MERGEEGETGEGETDKREREWKEDGDGEKGGGRGRKGKGRGREGGREEEQWELHVDGVVMSQTNAGNATVKSPN